MDSKNPEISVIVPVYKVEPYLRECIDSILAQTFTDFELILVDDGSPDNCGAICDEYAEKDNRVIVIHQKNQGVAAARNAGMDIMRGDYVAFIDSDDYISNTYLNVMLSAVTSEKADVATCRWLEIKNEKIITPPFRNKFTGNLTGPDAIYYMYSRKAIVGVEVWGKLISKKLLNEKRFPIDKACEDRAVVPYVIHEAERVVIGSAEVYFYRKREGSAGNQQFTRKRFDDVLHMNAFIAYLREQHDWKSLYAARCSRKRILCLYILKARLSNIYDIPNGCRMNVIEALYIMRKYYDYNWYSWYLNQIFPFWTRIDAYIRKIESILTGKPL